ELQCAPIQLARPSDRAQRASPVAGVAKSGARPRNQLVGGQARRAGEVERLSVVVRKRLGVIVPAAERLDPGRGGLVLERARRTWDLTTGDVPDEDVPEGVLRLARDRRDLGTENELLPLERVEQLHGAPGLAAA